MKFVKSLVLGSAAGIVAMSGAQAADLPLKAKAVEYVRVCSLYGAGFYYIPGTDTCIKLGGYLRVDVVANSNSDDTGNISGAGGAKNRFTNGFTWRSREDLNIDTRTATEYGVVRTYWDATFSWTTGDAVAASDPVGVYYAFIQFAGFTMGKAVSQFSAPWVNYPGNIFDGLVGGGGTVTGVNQFTYTADFGQGISASISAQDPTAYYQAGVQNLSAAGLGTPFGASDYAGTTVPDIVGMLRIDQAWGLFQLSAAAHDNNVAYYGGAGLPNGGTEFAGHPNDAWGFAVQGALSIKNIPTGPGDTINVQGVYTDGATRYNIQDLAGGNAGAPQVYGSTGVLGAYQSIALGLAPDTVFVNGGSQQLVQTWGMRGAYVHNWSPNWVSSIYGAYAQVNFNSTSKGLLCGAGGTFAAAFPGSAVTTCDPNYSISQLGLLTTWTPVKGLAFSADLTWQHVDTKMAGTVALPAMAAIGKPAATYALSNEDNVLLMLRAQRNW